MLTQNEILAFLRNNKELFAEKYSLVKIGLFGSFARNEQNENSDIDLVVEYKKNTEKLYDVEDNFKIMIKEKFNRKVDICSIKWMKPVFKSLILKDVIYV